MTPSSSSDRSLRLEDEVLEAGVEGGELLFEETLDTWSRLITAK